MAETIAIGFDVDQNQLQTTIDILEKLGQVDAKTAAAFRAESEKTRAALSQSVDKSKQGFSELDNRIKSVGTSARAALEFDKSKDVIKTAQTFVSLRQQIKESQNETARLAERFGALDSRTLEAANKTAKLRENLADVNAQIAALNPEAKFTAFTQLGGVLQGAFQAATGALQAFGVESEQATKLAQQFQGALNIAAGLNSLTGLKDAITNVKAILGITTTATVAATTANEGLAASEVAVAAGAESAAVATNTFTAALATNPITLALVAVAALASAYLLLSDDADEAAQSVQELNDQIKQNTAQSEINASVVDKTANALKGQLDILRAQGASKEEILKKEVELNQFQEKAARRQLILNQSEIDSLEDQAAALAYNTNLTEKEYKEQSAIIFSRIDALKKSNSQLKSEAESFRNDTLVKQAQFNSDQTAEQQRQIDQEAELNEQRLQEKRDLEYKLRQIGISLIADEFEKRRQQLKLDFDKEIDVYAQKLEEKRITLEEFNKVFAALNSQLNDNTDKVNLDQLNKSFADEKALREKNLNEILKVIDDQNKELQTKEINGILERLKAKQEAWANSGFSEVQIARMSNSFIEEEQRRSNIKLLKDDLETLVKKKNEISSSGDSIVDIENEIAKKRQEINDAVNANIVKSEEDAAASRQEILNGIIDGFSKAAEVITAFASLESQLAQNRIDQAKASLDARLQFIDDEDSANKDALERRNIGERDFKENEKQLLKQRKAANDEFRKKEAAEKRKAAIADRAARLFEIAIATAANSAKQPGPLGAFVPYWIALGLLQAGIVLAQPLPSYFKGTKDLKRGNNPVGIDTIPVMAHEGEAIIPTAKNKQYKNTVSAIFDGTVPSSILESFVINYNKPSSEQRTTVVNIDHKQLAREIGVELGYRLRGRNETTITNLSDLAEILKGNDGRRR